MRYQRRGPIHRILRVPSAGGSRLLRWAALHALVIGAMIAAVLGFLAQEHSSTAQASDRLISATVSPPAATISTSTKFTLTVEVTSGDRVGTVVAKLPAGFSNIGPASITAVSPGNSWTAVDCGSVMDDDAAGGHICATANVDQGDTLLVGEAITFTITATTPPMSGRFTWSVLGMQGNDFNGPRFAPASDDTDIPPPPTCVPHESSGSSMSSSSEDDEVVCTPTPTNTPTPTRTPTKTPTNTRTPTRTNTPVNTNTPTNTPPNTPTNTPVPNTFTPTPTRTSEVLPATVTPDRNVKGDVNCDGKVTSRDALMVLQLNAGLKNILPCMKNADVNNDARINALDAFLILQFHAGLIDRLPPR